MIKKTCLYPLLFVFMALVCHSDAAGQYLAPRMSIHFSNPLSLASKAGVKFQYRLSQQHSVLVGYRSYYGFFPGYQGSVEYQHYYRSFEHSEGFFYGKFGIGGAEYNAKPYYAGYDAPFDAPGGYGFVGAGAGKRYNIGHFFIIVNLGLKYSQILEKGKSINENLFYTLGPGSLIDFGMHFGFQFFNEERNMFHKTLAPRRHSRAW